MQLDNYAAFGDVPGAPAPDISAMNEETARAAIVSEVMEKVGLHENEFTKVFGEMNEAADSYRMLTKSNRRDNTSSLFNSKSGETNRAANTLGSLWYRMMTAADDYVEAISEGYDWMGREYTEEQLFGVEALQIKQSEETHYKENLFVSAKSCGLFGSAMAELNWAQFPAGIGEKAFEATEFNPRSMLLSGFDPFCTDIRKSDWVHFFDFPTKYQLRQWSANDTEYWDKARIEKACAEESSSDGSHSDAYNRIIQRKQRAGYSVSKSHVKELVTYRGKLDPENALLLRLRRETGGQTDIRFIDWKVRILNGKEIVAITPCFGGDWRHEVKVANFNKFELEPIGYGIGKTGRKHQAELDYQQTLLNNLATISSYMMFVINRMAQIKQNQLIFKPFGVIETDEMGGIDTLKVDVQTIGQVLQLMGVTKEDFRTTTGATANLQALVTKATATEASLTQTEAIRGGSVAAELIAENFVREYFKTAHLYNLAYLDNPVWVSVTGTKKPLFTQFSRFNLPRNVGFKVKVTTDKEFRPERVDKLIQLLQLVTSIRNVTPNGINVLPFFEEVSRGLGINPRRLKQPYPVADQMIDMARRAQASGKLGNEQSGEMSDEMSGSGAHTTSTPMGPVPTSPISSRMAA